MALSVQFRRQLVAALPHAAQEEGEYWFSHELDRLGTECAHKFGFSWLQINVVVRDALMSAGLDTTNPVIRWMAFVVARGLCQKLAYDAAQGKEAEDDPQVQAPE